MEVFDNLFEPILDSNEKVLKVIRPNKTKMLWSMLLSSFFIYIWIGLVVAFGFGSIFGDTVPLADGTEGVDLSVMAFGVSLAVTFALYVVLFAVLFNLAYKKTYYAYTNKRVVIRKGIIGVDYKSINKDSIGAVTVNVSLLDKIICKNTGTIVFGSMSSPIVANGAMFRFSHITDPYAIYKEIKANIDEGKTEIEVLNSEKNSEKQSQETEKTKSENSKNEKVKEVSEKEDNKK